MITVPREVGLMRHARVRIDPAGGAVHPLDSVVADDPSMTRVALHHIRRLQDGSAVVLYQVRGDEDRVRDLLGEREDIIRWSTAERDDGIYAYVHFMPAEESTAEELLRLTQELEVVITTPFECVEGGGYRVTLVGDEASLQRAADHAPAGIHLDLEELGRYTPMHDRLTSLLTDRQREILDEAVGAGYYEEPRQVTYEDLAERLGLSPATVGEHLRKIEGKVLRELSR